MFKKNGFTFIEVLIAMSLLAIVLLDIVRLQLSFIQNAQESMKSAIAIEQLQSIVVIMQMDSSNFFDFYERWNSVVRIYWHSNLSGRWYCSSNPLKNYTCFELKVF